jgi:hypothetical protein
MALSLTVSSALQAGEPDEAIAAFRDGVTLSGRGSALSGDAGLRTGRGRQA